MLAKHSMMAALAFGALLVSGCTADVPNPFASFESRCAKLPAARYDVVAVPFAIREVDTADIHELTDRSGASFAQHRTYGLTTVAFGHETQTELRVLEERGSGRTCATPHVTVRVSMQPVVVYIARELRGDTCRYAATRAHEMQHVAVFRAELADATRELRAQLAAQVGTQILHGPSAAELNRRYETRLREYLSTFMRARQDALNARQAQLDTPEEYAKVGAGCQ
jgi:hypothetical protein